jgi:hypothetical protein
MRRNSNSLFIGVLIFIVVAFIFAQRRSGKISEVQNIKGSLAFEKALIEDEQSEYLKHPISDTDLKELLQQNFGDTSLEKKTGHKTQRSFLIDKGTLVKEWDDTHGKRLYREFLMPSTNGQEIDVNFNQEMKMYFWRKNKSEDRTKDKEKTAP